MTRGQESLMIGLDDEPAPREVDSEGAPAPRAAIRVMRASAEECAAARAALDDIAKANKGLCLWLPPERNPRRQGERQTTRHRRGLAGAPSRWPSAFLATDLLEALEDVVAGELADQARALDHRQAAVVLGQEELDRVDQARVAEIEVTSRLMKSCTVPSSRRKYEASSAALRQSFSDRKPTRRWFSSTTGAPLRPCSSNR